MKEKEGRGNLARRVSEWVCKGKTTRKKSLLLVIHFSLQPNMSMSHIGETFSIRWWRAEIDTILRAYVHEMGKKKEKCAFSHKRKHYFTSVGLGVFYHAFITVLFLVFRRGFLPSFLPCVFPTEESSPCLPSKAPAGPLLFHFAFSSCASNRLRQQRGLTHRRTLLQPQTIQLTHSIHTIHTDAENGSKNE